MTTLILRDCSDVAASVVDGYLEFQGGAGHTSGWLSPIPAMWQGDADYRGNAATGYC